MLNAITDVRVWDFQVSTAASYDIFHMAGYHQLAAMHGEGDPILVSFTSGEHSISLPLLLRPLSEVPGLEHFDGMDATSVHGYAGPVASKGYPGVILRTFQSELSAFLREKKIISLFNRLHPFLPEMQSSIVSGMGDIFDSGATVSIDLTQCPAKQVKNTRTTRLHIIRKCAAAGISCIVDEKWDELGQFANMYHDAMRRVGAPGFYFYPHSYFEALRDNLGDNADLVCARIDHEVVCGAIFLLCRDMVHYHLSTTRADCLKLSPMSYLIDWARWYYKQKGYKTLHLGGGIGGRRDSLFDFKASFAAQVHAFRVWRWIVNRDRYQAAMDVRKDFGRDPRFFPEYRGQDL